jgi:hypothetical protein
MAFFAQAVLASRSHAIDLPRRPIPTLESAHKALQQSIQVFKRIQEQKASPQEIRTAECDIFGAEETLTLARAAEENRLEAIYQSCLPAEIQLVQIGPWNLFAWPGEFFVEYALAVKKQCKNTFVISLANGELQGYIVTPEAVENGYYEAATLYSLRKADNALSRKPCICSIQSATNRPAEVNVNRPTDDSQIAAGRRDLVLGIDLGTSYFKLGLFDRQGELRGMGRIFVAKDRGDGSRCEVPVDRFWALLCRGMSEACRQASASPEQICGLSYASQANSFLLLDRDMAPLTPLILWADDRAAETDSLATLFKRSDFLPNTGIGIPPIAPVLPGQSRLAQAAPACAVCTSGLFDDHLGLSLLGADRRARRRRRHRFTARLLDQRTLTWRREMIDLGDLRLSMPLQPGTPAGKLSRNGAALLGLKPGVPFALGNLDHPAAALGAGAGQIADLSESTGTVLACVRFVADYSPRPGSCTGAALSRASTTTRV